MTAELPTTPSPQKPQEFGPYLIIDKLGSGGMGKVYLAIEREYDRKVAIKISDAADNLRDEDIRRFEAEAKTMKELNHQNIIQVFSYGVVGDRQYISMRLIEGPTLREKQRRKGKFDHATIVDFAKQIARGLLYAHRKGVVHRDIKPSNILVDEEDRLVISDFGISTTSSSDHLTLPGMAMGTPEYMSPEQCQGFEVTSKSDIYSFGIILYELLTGSPPFTGQNPLSTAYKQVNEQPPDVSSIRKDTPPQLAAIVEMCLAKRADSRFSSMEQVLNALDAVEIGSLTQMRKKVSKWSRRSLTQPVIQQKSRELQRPIIRTLLMAAAAILLFVAGRHFAPAQKSGGGLRPIDAAIYLDEERLSALEDRDQNTWAAIPQDAEGRPHSLLVDLQGPKLIYTVAITLIPTDHSAASSLKRTRRPAELRLENERGQVRHLKLPSGLPGAHYLSINPISAEKLLIKITRSSGELRDPIVLCDLGMIGIDLPSL